MNTFQGLWWEQAKTDYETFLILRRENASVECHLLHYLQMATEKIAKAHGWGQRTPPPKTHSGFTTLLKYLAGVHNSKNQIQIAALFGFSGYGGFRTWVRQVMPIAHGLEHVAPALANNGPNPEYPWPHAQPIEAPVNHKFDIWKDLSTNALGRRLMTVIQVMVSKFPQYAEI